MSTTQYQFAAFPTRWYDRKRKRWSMGCLSTLNFDTLMEARREITRLKRIYRQLDKDRAADPKDWSHSLLSPKPYPEPHFLRVTRVDYTPVDP